MSTLLTFLVIISAYFLGFLTAATLSAGSSADEWGREDSAKTMPTTHSMATEEESMSGKTTYAIVS